jgi:hypothetical protein
MEHPPSMFAEQNLHSLPSSKILSMTPEERMQAMQDLHGALDIPEESPSIIQTKLTEMDEMLRRLEPRLRGGYDEAVKQSPNYVKRFRLAFLRAEALDPAKAAQRMANHFALRLELFQTKDVLGRDIMISDLSGWKDDQPLIQTSAMQLLKRRDRVGRSIILICPGKLPYLPYHFPSLVSALEDFPSHPSELLVSPSRSSHSPHRTPQGRFLLMLSVMAAQNLGKDAQRKGVVLLWFGHVPNRVISNPGISGHNGQMFFSMFSALPIRIRGVHACHDDARYTQTFNSMMDVAKPEHAIRFQSHFGSLDECFRSLRRYGIPKEILPLDEQGNLETSDFRDMLLRYRTEMDDGGEDRPEDRSLIGTSSTVPFPTDNDILLGKGKRGDRFRGNQLLRKAIAENYDAYDTGNRRTKLAILHLVYFHLLQAGCRFLKPVKSDADGQPALWMEVAEDEALGKISMGIRNYRRKGPTAGREFKGGSPSYGSPSGTQEF